MADSDKFNTVFEKRRELYSFKKNNLLDSYLSEATLIFLYPIWLFSVSFIEQSSDAVRQNFKGKRFLNEICILV